MKKIDKALACVYEHSLVFVLMNSVSTLIRVLARIAEEGQQTAVPTSGKNQKRYLAGVHNARIGKVIWIE
jgi:hypothetical protein